jgi:hypothetical protein
MGIQTFEKISHLFLTNLKGLNFYSDPIDNKTIKQLFKLDMPQLASFSICNTNATNDVVRIIRKRPINHFRSFDLCAHNGCHNNDLSEGLHT